MSHVNCWKVTFLHNRQSSLQAPSQCGDKSAKPSDLPANPNLSNLTTLSVHHDLKQKQRYCWMACTKVVTSHLRKPKKYIVNMTSFLLWCLWLCWHLSAYQLYNTWFHPLQFLFHITSVYHTYKFHCCWGCLAQPGSTYYLQKVSHDVFGVVDHHDNQQYITLSMRGLDQRIPTTPYLLCRLTLRQSQGITHGLKGY